MPSSHQAQASWTPARILAWAETIGPNTQVVCETIMSGRHYLEQGFNQCRAIFNLASKIYDKDRVEAACARAIAIHSPLYKSVVSILKNGLDAFPLVTPPGPAPIEHANIRGAEYYQEILNGASNKESQTC